MKSYRKELWFFFAALVFVMLAPKVIAESLYVDSNSGRDGNPGTKEKPFRTIEQAATVVNSKTGAGSTTIKIAPGVYSLTRCVVFKNGSYTEKDRLVIEATILPDDPDWRPALMPVILSTEDRRKNCQNIFGGHFTKYRTH